MDAVDYYEDSCVQESFLNHQNYCDGLISGTMISKSIQSYTIHIK